MSKAKKLGWFAMGVLATLLVQAGAVWVMTGKSSRPAAPPEDADVSMPWGALDLDEFQNDPDPAFQRSMADSIREEKPEEFDPDGDGVRTYDLLALSGGGSYGAFGAGFLCGWTESGTRPKFKIVTGLSTGCLQAVAAFLGPQYDPILRETYTTSETRDIYTRRFALRAALMDGMNTTAGLKRLIDRHVTEQVLADVAAEHAKGRRLFVGTTNMDTGQFIAWDMGRIAASGRGDSLAHFRSVLYASASAPVYFPPVYFKVEADGKSYHEMHADGATQTQVFFRGMLLDLDDALDDAGVPASKVQGNLYVILNGQADDKIVRKTLKPRTLSIASATIGQLMNMRERASFYRVYVLAHRYNIDFNMIAIPQDVPVDFSFATFDKPGMKRLFDTGYKMAADGAQWLKVPPGLDKDEIIRPKGKQNRPR